MQVKPNRAVADDQNGRKNMKSGNEPSEKEGGGEYIKIKLKTKNEQHDTKETEPRNQSRALL